MFPDYFIFIIRQIKFTLYLSDRKKIGCTKKEKQKIFIEDSFTVIQIAYGTRNSFVFFLISFLSKTKG